MAAWNLEGGLRMRKTALVTGAANGIGRALSARLIRDGFQLFLTDVDGEKLTEVFGDQASDSVRLRTLDVTDANAWQATMVAFVEQFGQIDYLVNNAGVIEPGWSYQMSIESIDSQIDINVKGTLYGIKVAGAQMVAQGHGHIINMVSLAGLTPVPGIGVYVASKHAVKGMSLSAAVEMAPKGVYVSALCPDLVNTHMLDVQLYAEEAQVTFSGNPNPMAPEDIVEEILNVMASKKMIVSVPRSRGILANFAGLFPSIGKRLYGSMRAKGAKQQALMQEQVQGESLPK